MKKIVSLVIIAIILLATLSVSAATTYNMKLKAETTEIEVGQNKIIFYIDLTEYSGDGVLGYEGVLEFDKDVFESALVESLNDWEKATYDATTGKIISTTSDAEAGKDIAKVTLTIKENVSEDETEINLRNFTLSDGNLGDTFNEKITYTFKKSATNTNQNNTEAGTSNGTNSQENGTTTGGTDTNGTNNSAETPSRNTNDEQNNQATGGENNATPVETNAEESSRENTETATEGNKKIETVGELKDDDSTTAQNKIPQTGSTALEITIVAIIAVIGLAAFIRFKTIKLK